MTELEVAPCTVFNKDGCFTSNTKFEDDTSGLPFMASLWFGVRALLEAVTPVTLFYAWKVSHLATVDRNSTYK